MCFSKVKRKLFEFDSILNECQYCLQVFYGGRMYWLQILCREVSNNLSKWTHRRKRQLHWWYFVQKGWESLVLTYMHCKNKSKPCQNLAVQQMMLSCVFYFLSENVKIPAPVFYEDFEELADVELFNDPVQTMGKVTHLFLSQCLRRKLMQKNRHSLHKIIKVFRITCVNTTE